MKFTTVISAVRTVVVVICIAVTMGMPIQAGATVQAINAVNIVVPYGQTGTLPSTVVLSNNGVPESYAVRWSAINPTIFEQPGQYTVDGTVIALGQSVTGIITVAAQNTAIKVAAVGDSITAGMGASNPNITSYPAQLQSMLGT
ncbi:MAG: Ig-like domain-containing protein, partial [Rhodanobacter sp.]|nr:Ig-like domain-containing protein [Rhodanobacter sp.]